ncbi:hypothetical protein [Metabacillus fastidiosus]|uniref:hypothetical protein n=1 Tax=Metabacillus fastidiosus TaxID=1458 RepID=UPI003D2CE90C
MRAYSEVNVMQEYLEKPPVGVFAKLISSMSKKMPADLEIMLPKRLFLKGELITETISQEIEKSFCQSDLVDLLTKELLAYYSLNTNPLKLYRTFKEISSSFMVTRHYDEGKENLVPVTIRLSKKDIFKLEMLVADIEEVQGETDLTVERLLELQYLNFMIDLLQGNNEDAIQRIIRSYLS